MKTTQKKILLPTDFSDNAKHSLDYALNLYANESCTFYFLHSIYSTTSASRTYITTHYVDKLLKESKRRLTELMVQTKIDNTYANHDFEILVSEQDINNAVYDAVKQYDIDIVVMGTKGASNTLGYFMGSNTVNVLKKIRKCPVLIIPNAYEFVEPKQIAFPTDYNRFYDEKELRPLKGMADLFNSKIRVVHIDVEEKLSEVQEYNLTMLKTYLSDYKHSIHCLPDYTKKSKAIATFIDDQKIDMLAMVNYNHSLIERILIEPVIKKLAFHPSVPILVISA